MIWAVELRLRQVIIIIRWNGWKIVRPSGNIAWIMPLIITNDLSALKITIDVKRRQNFNLILLFKILWNSSVLDYTRFLVIHNPDFFFSLFPLQMHAHEMIAELKNIPKKKRIEMDTIWTRTRCKCVFNTPDYIMH